MTTWAEVQEQLAPKTINASIRLSYGREISIPIGTLSYHEWTLCGLDVEDPPVPRTLVGPKGERLPNREDVTYVRQAQAVAEERSYRRLALALEKGGVAVPGATSAEKAKTIRSTIDAGVAVALMRLLADAVYGGEAELTAQAENF